MRSQLKVSGEDKEAVLMHPLTPGGGGSMGVKGQGKEMRWRAGEEEEVGEMAGGKRRVGQRKQKHTISDKKKQQNVHRNVLNVP